MEGYVIPKQTVVSSYIWEVNGNCKSVNQKCFSHLFRNHVFIAFYSYWPYTWIPLCIYLKPKKQLQ